MYCFKKILNYIILVLFVINCIYSGERLNNPQNGSNLLASNAAVSQIPTEPLSYKTKFLTSVNMDIIVKEDTERFIAQSRKLFFVGLKAAFHQSYNGANGDEIVVNRSYSIGARGAYFFPVKNSHLKLGGILDFGLNRRTQAGNEYDNLHENLTFLDYLEMNLMFAGIVKGVYFGMGGGVSLLAKHIELPSHMKNVEPFACLTLGYMYELPFMKIMAGFDIRVALYTVDLKSARSYPAFELTTNKRRPVSFMFTIGLGY